jgi:hypothetical protein
MKSLQVSATFSGMVFLISLSVAKLKGMLPNRFLQKDICSFRT